MVIVGVVTVHENREAGTISQVDKADSIESIGLDLACTKVLSDPDSSLIDSICYPSTGCTALVAFGKEVDSIGSWINHRCTYDTDEVGNVGTSDVALQERGHDNPIDEVGSGLGIKSANAVFAGSEEEDLLSAVDVRAGVYERSPVPFLLGIIRFCPKHSECSGVDHGRVHVVIGKVSRTTLIGISDGVGRSLCSDQQRQEAQEGGEIEPHLR